MKALKTQIALIVPVVMIISIVLLALYVRNIYG